VICLVFGIFLQYANAKYSVDLGSQHEQFEGDIRLPIDRNGILPAARWPNGVIPYEWSNTSKDKWGQTHKDTMAAVMKDIEDHTCIRFVKRSNEVNFVKINGSDCSSSVGKNGGMQLLSLSDSDCCGTCWDFHTVIHETLHAVGLWHEQSRYDRDEYITIHYENIVNGSRFNFDIHFQNESNTYGVEYDYFSIMHYQKNVCTKNGGITIETKDADKADFIGKMKRASENDFEKVRRIYECTGTYPTVPPQPGSICEDTLTYCTQQIAECGKAEWARKGCRKTCKFCKPADPTCKDTVNYCWKQKDKCGKEEWMKNSCRKTCRFC